MKQYDLCFYCTASFNQPLSYIHRTMIMEIYLKCCGDNNNTDIVRIVIVITM